MEFNPYPYQQYCIDSIVYNRSIGLFLDMGLGKTVITLTAIHELRYNRWEVRKPLVIAPKKVAEATWTSEARKWDNLRGMRIVPVLGTLQQRLRALATPADLYVINRENTQWLVEHFKNGWPFDMVVLDESSSFKNGSSKRFKALKLVRGRIRRMVALTGTPASNGLEDLWAQVYLLDGGARLGPTLGAYRDKYFLPGQRNRTTIFNYTPKEGSFDMIQKAISDICISMKAEDYLTLPDVVFNDIPVALDARAAKAYMQLEQDLLLKVDENTITANSAGVLTGKLLQLCNGAIYDDTGEINEIHAKKLDALEDLIEAANGKPLLVAYWFQHDLQRIMQRLHARHIPFSKLDSSESIRRWNNGELPVALIHPASAGHGLNLQAGGNSLVWFGLTWSLELYQQTIARLWRQGQTSETVIVQHLTVADSIDEQILRALQAKDRTQAALIAAVKADLKI